MRNYAGPCCMGSGTDEVPQCAGLACIEHTAHMLLCLHALGTLHVLLCLPAWRTLHVLHRRLLLPASLPHLLVASRHIKLLRPADETHSPECFNEGINYNFRGAQLPACTPAAASWLLLLQRRRHCGMLLLCLLPGCCCCAACLHHVRQVAPGKVASACALLDSTWPCYVPCRRPMAAAGPSWCRAPAVAASSPGTALPSRQRACAGTTQSGAGRRGAWLPPCCIGLMLAQPRPQRHAGAHSP